MLIGRCLASLLLGGALAGCSSHPDDATLISEFEKQRADYDALALMVSEDAAFSRIAADFVHPDWSLPEDAQPDHLPPERWSDYRRKFAALGLESGVTIYEGGKVIVAERSSSGLVTSGSSKGFMRAARLPKGYSLSESRQPLDCEVGEEGHCAVAKRIADDWYLVLERH